MSSDLPYRPCVGIMLLNRDGKVFVGKRIDQTVEGWQMPQGGIDKGETPKQAVLRELQEEVGTAKAEIIGEMDDWVTYDLPAASDRRGLSRQVQRPEAEMVRAALYRRGGRHRPHQP